MKRGFEEKYPKKGNIILIQIYRKVNILNRILANLKYSYNIPFEKKVRIWPNWQHCFVVGVGGWGMRSA
jgi:alpha-N-acetylglucosamine transferase